MFPYICSPTYVLADWFESVVYKTETETRYLISLLRRFFLRTTPFPLHFSPPPQPPTSYLHFFSLPLHLPSPHPHPTPSRPSPSMSSKPWYITEKGPEMGFEGSCRIIKLNSLFECLGSRPLRRVGSNRTLISHGNETPPPGPLHFEAGLAGRLQKLQPTGTTFTISFRRDGLKQLTETLDSDGCFGH